MGTPRINFDAPQDRLRLLTVANKPAIAELPIQGHLLSVAKLVVIQRFPDSQRPGIAIGIQATDLNAAVSLAEQIMK